MACLISASIIAADFKCLGEEINKVIDAGVDGIHLDVMDHHYVPNLSIGPAVCQSIAASCTVPIDAHLMVEQPDL